MAPSCDCSAQKCMKPGRRTRNGYLNFLREFRTKNCGLSAVEIVRKGAQMWRSMSQKNKSKFIEEAKKEIKTPRRSRMRARGMRSTTMRGGRKPVRRARVSRARRRL